MKSGKAKKIIRETDLYISVQGVMFQDSRAMMKKDAIKAVEIAEQEAEERMRKKAIEAYCSECTCYETGVCALDPDKCATKLLFVQNMSKK